MKTLTGDDIDRAAERWRTDGWVVVEELVPRAEVEAALAQVPRIEAAPDEATNPSRNRLEETYADEGDKADTGGLAFRRAQFSGTSLFPLPDAPALNRLFVHPQMVAFARAALQTPDIRLYQSRLWSKYTGRTNYSQPLHQDRNHSLVPTRSEPGWWHIELFLYLTDVDETTGAPQAVPLSSPAHGHEGLIPTPDDAPDLYEAATPAVGPAGSLFAYRSDVWHRGVDLTRPGGERHIVVASFKPAGVDWIGYDSHPPLSINHDFARFVADSTPDQLSLFGIPTPGHPYWTPATIDGFARLYPDLDVEPWRRALADRPPVMG